jgi:hypothetical protein
MKNMILKYEYVFNKVINAIILFLFFCFVFAIILFFFLKLYQDPHVLRKVQGLNAQAKGEVQIIISGKGRAIQAKGEVIISGRGRAIQAKEEVLMGRGGNRKLRFFFYLFLP